MFQSEGLAALWTTDSVGWNAKPEGTGGCRAWIPGQPVLEFHKSDEEPEAARALRGLPYLAQPRSAHEQVALTQRGLQEAWPQWMMDTIR